MNTGTTPRLVQKKTMKALTTLLAVLAVLALITVTLSITITQEALAHRVTGKELTLHSDNGQPQGLWASETHFYVSDPEDDHVYAYQRTDGLRATSKEISLHQDNRQRNLGRRHTSLGGRRRGQAALRLQPSVV